MSSPRGAASDLTLLGASAGSGKTHRLTEIVVRAVTRADGPVDPAALAAVTYTRRAASELAARIRRALVAAGAHDRAQRLPLAYLGTVHSVCLRLVQEFAIDAGLSPQVDVLPGDEARWLREALEWGIEPGLRDRVQALADGLELRWNAQLRRTDWLTPVQDLMALARGNRIAAASLPAMAERSAASLLSLMGPAVRDGAALEAELVEALEGVARALATIDDGVKKTLAAREAVDRLLPAARAGTLSWADWVRLQHLEPARDVVPIVAPVVEVACRVEQHPRLQAEVRELIGGMYEAARQGLDAYDDWKKHRRVVDFVDMIDRALTLVERPEVQGELRSRLQLLVVDEFQDTSPVQLALFVRLHPLAGRSTWVGDRKQCIFEFAGADPQLMEAVTAWVARSGGDTPHLDRNYRSRPELVATCSALFAAAFARHGYRPDEVEVQPTRVTPAGLSTLPPLGLWWLAASNQGESAAALAEGVRRLLESPEATPVVDRSTDAPRPLRGGDVAILVATNKEADDVATELARRGVRATVARAGLLSTPEGTLVQAALCALVDPRDERSRAVVEALTGFGGHGADAWLDARIAAVRERGADAGRETEAPAPQPLARLAALRARVETLAPSEALDSVLSALDVAGLCARWPDPEQRLANLDALRALTARYEQHCGHQRAAATIAGLLRFFEEAATRRLVRDEEVASDDQHVAAGEHAVTLVTYHRAKGLEWPVVVLSSLERGDRRDAFEVCPETDRAAFDAADPLGGRWIRYWPWPFGLQKKARLAEAAAASPEGRSVALREERERARLLYVGFTRARDHLILAARAGKRGPSVKWLDELCDGEGRPLLELPAGPDAAGVSSVRVRGPHGKVTGVPARHWLLGTGVAEPERLPSADSHVWFATPSVPVPARPPYWIAPSQAGSDWPEVVLPRVLDVTTIGERVPLGQDRAVGWDVVGDAVHAFLAADVEGLDAPDRLELARRLLVAAGLLPLLSPGALLRAGDQLRAWVASSWPEATWQREVAVTAVVSTPDGTRRVQGTIDLLLETAHGVVIVNHKSFPGAGTQWAAKAAEFAPQLAAYAQVLQAAGKRIAGLYVHFTLGAGVVRLGP